MEKKIKAKYTSACNAYLRAFCEKHGFDYDPEDWVGGSVGEIACVGEYYYVNMPTIIADHEQKASAEEFFKWYTYCERAAKLKSTIPNFGSWLKGCPRMSEEQLCSKEKKTK
jgi:hypothetical protein